MKLAIFGSRSITGATCEALILKAIDEHRPEYLVTSGETAGVCAMTRQIARRKAIPLILHFADNEGRAAGKYEWRSKAVLNECNFCVFIHDGKSKGTINEIEVAKKLSKPHSYHKIKLGIETQAVQWKEFNFA